jgi:hypothetical protein
MYVDDKEASTHIPYGQTPGYHQHTIRANDHHGTPTRGNLEDRNIQRLENISQLHRSLHLLQARDSTCKSSDIRQSPVFFLEEVVMKEISIENRKMFDE